MDGIKESLDKLSELSEGELSDLETAIISEFETFEKQDEHTSETVDAMTALADALDSVRGEQSARVTLAADLEKRAAEATARVRAESEATKVEDELDEDGNPKAASPPEGEQPPNEVEGTPSEALPDGEKPAEESPKAEDEEEDEDKKKVPTTFSEADPEPQPSEGEPAEEPVQTDPDTESPPEPAAPATPAGGGDTGPTNVPDAPSSTATESTAPSLEAVSTAVPATSDVAPSIEPPATQEIPVAASAHDVVVTPPADSRPVVREHASVAITAGADIPGISAGTTLNSVREVAEAFTKRLHNLARVSSPNGQQYTVATITADYPEERKLYAGDMEGNWAKVEKVVAPQVITAAGACVPLEIRYDIFGTGVTDTPVADSLPKFSADRGGIQFTPGPLLPSAPYDAGMGVWNATTGAVTDMDAVALPGGKPCYTVECIDPVQVEVEALSMCLCFDNLTSRVYPELVARHNDLALIQWARITEQRLLTKIKAGATTTITATGILGAAREILGQVDKVAAGLRYRNRLSPTQPLRAIFPYWLRDMVRADVAFQMPGDGFEDTLDLADSALNGWFSARKINVTWSMESNYASTAIPAIANIASTTGGFPATVEWDLFAEGTFLVLDGGTLDLGVIRDSTHVASNTYCEFAESFLNVAKIGGDSIHVTSTLKASGQAASLEDTSGI